MNDYIIVAISSEGTVRNGSGDTIKMELMDILKGCLLYTSQKTAEFRKMVSLKFVAV